MEVSHKSCQSYELQMPYILCSISKDIDSDQAVIFAYWDYYYRLLTSLLHPCTFHSSFILYPASCIVPISLYLQWNWVLFSLWLFHFKWILPLHAVCNWYLLHILNLCPLNISPDWIRLILDASTHLNLQLHIFWLHSTYLIHGCISFASLLSGLL